MPPKTNGFWMFAMATTKGMNPNDAKRQAAVMWDSMGEEKREEWRLKARTVRAKEKGALAAPINSTSSTKQATPRASPKASRSEVMKKSLHAGCDKRDMTFIVADVLIWCDALDKGKTLPAEISLTQFSVNQGVISTKNWEVPAPEIPQGYQWDMRKASEEGHKLPINDDFNLGYPNPEKRVLRIVTEILEFIGYSSTVKRRYAAEYAMSSSVEPVIYAMPEKEEIVEKSLHYIMSKVGVHKKDARFFVCPLDELLYEICLSSKFVKEAGAITKQVAHIQLQKNTNYLWMDGLKCPFHSSLPDDSDVTNEHCARALSRTHAFRFLAVACVAHDVQMIRDVHFHVDETPSEAATPDWPTQAQANNAAPDAILGTSLKKAAGAPDPDSSALTETDDMDDLKKRFCNFALEE